VSETRNKIEFLKPLVRAYCDILKGRGELNEAAVKRYLDTKVLLVREKKALLAYIMESP